MRFTRNARHILVSAILGLLVSLLLPEFAHAVCSHSVIGGWQKTGGESGPDFLRIRFSSCGDTPDTITTIAVEPWVWRSDRTWFERPTVQGDFVQDQTGRSWLRADVPTGGYVDEMWIRNDGGNDALQVYIRHRSLSQNPDAESWNDFIRRE